MSARDDEVTRAFHDAYSVLLERSPEPPAFEQITEQPIAATRTGRPGRTLDDFDLRRNAGEPASAPPRRRVLIALAAAAAVLLTAGIAASHRGDPDLATTDVPPSSIAESSVAAVPAVDDSPDWSLVFHPDAFGDDGEVRSIVAGGPGFVAVGQRDEDAAVWTSVDGLAWAPVPHDDSVFEAGSGIADVIAGGPGLIAVGRSCNDGVPAAAECVDGDAAVWTSVDGLTWSPIPHDDEVSDGVFSFEMTSVTAGGPGFVAVGSSWEFEEPDGAAGWERVDGDAAVWTSVDGLSWSRVPHDDDVFGGERNQAIGDVTAAGPGLVAVGRDGPHAAWDNSPRQAAAVWTSTDGLQWSRVPHDDAVFGVGGPAMIGVTPGGPGLVAVGWSSPHDAPAPVWTSPDGLVWSPVTHDNRQEMSGTMTAVTAGGPGLVAVGAQGTGAAAWTSPDGITWSPAQAENESEASAGWLWDVIADDDRPIGPGFTIEESD